MAATAQRIREAGDREVPRAVDALRRAGFAGEGIIRLVEYPRVSDDGAVLVAEGGGGRVEGVACCASFGATGWIGALGVVPGARRRGLGAALTEAATAWLQRRGAQTVLLYATDMGRPVYERLGFDVDGPATAFRGVAGRPGRGAPDVRPYAGSDLPALKEVDRLVTGEDRSAVLDTLRPGAGVVADAPDGGLRGWAVASPWGSGAAIGARDPDAGLALVAAASGGPVPGTVVVPDANEEAVRALRHWGFARLNDALRMRLGPEVGWRPELQFGLFNLFWG